MTEKIIIPGWKNNNGPTAIMIIGIAPSVHGAAVNGKPLSTSRSGKILWTILEKAGLDQEPIYITNLIKFALPDNREPTKQEIEEQIPLLMKEIEEQSPKKIIALGNIVRGALLHSEFRKFNISFVKIYHPSYIVRNPDLMNVTVNHLRAFIRK
jgi:uracil-DNA glycosylase family 4